MEGEGLDPPSHKFAFMRENVLWLPFLRRTVPRAAEGASWQTLHPLQTNSFREIRLNRMELSRLEAETAENWQFLMA